VLLLLLLLLLVSLYTTQHSDKDNGLALKREVHASCMLRK
jgi:hypothetical protein